MPETKVEVQRETLQYTSNTLMTYIAYSQYLHCIWNKEQSTYVTWNPFDYNQFTTQRKWVFTNYFIPLKVYYTIINIFALTRFDIDSNIGKETLLCTTNILLTRWNHTTWSSSDGFTNGMLVNLPILCIIVSFEALQSNPVSQRIGHPCLCSFRVLQVPLIHF